MIDGHATPVRRLIFKVLLGPMIGYLAFPPVVWVMDAGLHGRISLVPAILSAFTIAGLLLFPLTAWIVWPTVYLLGLVPSLVTAGLLAYPLGNSSWPRALLTAGGVGAASTAAWLFLMRLFLQHGPWFLADPASQRNLLAYAGAGAVAGAVLWGGEHRRYSR